MRYKPPGFGSSLFAWAIYWAILMWIRLGLGFEAAALAGLAWLLVNLELFALYARRKLDPEQEG